MIGDITIGEQKKPTTMIFKNTEAYKTCTFNIDYDAYHTMFIGYIRKLKRPD